VPYKQTPMNCSLCGIECMRKGPGQRYCETCSEARDLERKKLWARSNPPSSEVRERKVAHQKTTKERAKEAGVAVGAETKQSIAWNTGDPALAWMTRISIQFTYAASKNHIYANTPRGHRYMRLESRAVQDEIAIRLRSAIAGQRIVHNKVWIDILVQKSNHRGDAVNFVDLVCDGVKKAIPVDDRWFSIRRLDWEVVKSDPRIYIGVGQEDVEDCQICSYCGRILSFDNFGKRSGTKLGISRECHECRIAGRKLARGRKELS
jgi:uncharacterized Zn-finger protein